MIRVVLVVSLLLFGSLGHASWLSEGVKSAEKAWKNSVKVVVNGVSNAFDSISDALAFLDKELLKVRKKTIVLDDQYWKKQQKKIDSSLSISKNFDQFKKDLGTLQRDISLNNIDKLDDNLEWGGTTGRLWEEGKEWVRERLADSGPRGPKLMKDRPFIQPFEHIKASDSMIIGLISSNNNSWLSKVMDDWMHGVGSLSIDESGNAKLCSKDLQNRPENNEGGSAPAINFCVIGLESFIREEFAKAGIVCPSELYELAKAGVPGVHLERVDEVEWCKLANQHRANRFREGYERDRQRAACVLEWSTRRFDDWLTKIPPLFKCVDIRPEMEANKLETEKYIKQTIEQFETEYADKIGELKKEILELEIEKSLTEAEKNTAKAEVSRSQYEENIRLIVEKTPEIQAASVSIYDQLEYFSKQVDELVAELDKYSSNAADRIDACDSQDYSEWVKIKKLVDLLNANSRRMSSVVGSADVTEEVSDVIYSSIAKADHVSNTFGQDSLFTAFSTCSNTQELTQTTNFESYKTSIDRALRDGHLNSAYELIESMLNAVAQNKFSVSDQDRLEKYRAMMSTLFFPNDYQHFDSTRTMIQKVKSDLNENEKLIMNFLLLQAADYDSKSGSFAVSQQFRSVDDLKNYETKLKSAREIINVFK